MRATAGLSVLAALTAAALASGHHVTVALICVGLLVACLRAPRWRVYVAGALVPAALVFLLSPLVGTVGYDELWQGPRVPVLGELNVTWEEMDAAALQALRLAAVGLAFAAYALLLDHDRLVGAARFARRSVLLVALATRLVPTLERDARGYVDALEGRGVAVAGVRGRARLLSPLVAGSLERALNLAEAMEARGYGRPLPRRAKEPRRHWPTRDRVVVAAAVAVAVGCFVWL
ncbi:MAG: energy-coupling factor transporter transmembrane component T [Gaiellaceae bacterium]